MTELSMVLSPRLTARDLHQVTSQLLALHFRSDGVDVGTGVEQRRLAVGNDAAGEQQCDRQDLPHHFPSISLRTSAQVSRTAMNLPSLMLIWHLTLEEKFLWPGSGLRMLVMASALRSIGVPAPECRITITRKITATTSPGSRPATAAVCPRRCGCGFRDRTES